MFIVSESKNGFELFVYDVHNFKKELSLEELNDGKDYHCNPCNYVKLIRQFCINSLSETHKISLSIDIVEKIKNYYEENGYYPLCNWSEENFGVLSNEHSCYFCVENDTKIVNNLSEGCFLRINTKGEIVVKYHLLKTIDELEKILPDYAEYYVMK